jgi:hypothetical protein
MHISPAAMAIAPGVRGGTNNTAGYLQYQGVPIPHPPVISPNPTTGATITANELALFQEGINRAGQLESTCDTCSDVTSGSPVTGLGELDRIFPQFHTNSSGLGARHNADQCLLCHSQPTLGGSGGFLVPNPGQGTPQVPENPLFRLVPLRFGKQNTVPSFEQRYGPIREVRFQFNQDGTRDGSVHQLWVVKGITRDPTIPNCAITQPDFATQASQNNLSFRIPLQLSGLGLIDSIPDQTFWRASTAPRTNARASALPAIPTAAPMTTPSPGLAGRRRTSRSRCSLARHTTSRWASPTSSFRPRLRKPPIATAPTSPTPTTSPARPPTIQATTPSTILRMNSRT